MSEAASAQDLKKKIEEIAKMTPAQLEALAKEGNTILFTGVINAEFTAPELRGGWKLMIAAPKRDGAIARLILLPKGNRTRQIWMEGQVKIAMDAGLSQVHGMAWAESRVSRKHDVLKRLAEVMKQPSLVTAYNHYKPDCEKEEYFAWASQWEVRDGLAPRHRAALVTLIKELEAAEAATKGQLAHQLQEVSVDQQLKAAMDQNDAAAAAV